MTRPAQLDKKRFDLEWVIPLEPGLSTHVAVYDLECVPPHAIAVGEGGDEAEALLDLWNTIRDHSESAEASTFVAAAYERRTGRQTRTSANEVTRSGTACRLPERSDRKPRTLEIACRKPERATRTDR